MLINQFSSPGWFVNYFRREPSDAVSERIEPGCTQSIGLVIMNVYNIAVQQDRDQKDDAKVVFSQTYSGIILALRPSSKGLAGTPGLNIDISWSSPWCTLLTHCFFVVTQLQIVGRPIFYGARCLPQKFAGGVFFPCQNLAGLSA